MSAHSLGSNLRAAVEAVRSLVTAMHEGRVDSVTAPVKVRREFLYFTPSYVAGQGMTSFNSQPYSLAHLCSLLGNRTASGKANATVRIALRMLELKELGALTEEDFADIFNGDDGFTQSLLQEVLTRTREAHYVQEAENLLARAV